MKKLFLVIMLALFSQFANAGTFIPDDWSEADTVRQTVVIATLAADMSQTLQIKDNPHMYERNPILGKHPSDPRL